MKTESEVLDILNGWDRYINQLYNIHINALYRIYGSRDCINNELTRDEFEQDKIGDSLDDFALSYRTSRILKFGVKNEVHNTPFGAIDERNEIKKIIQMHREFPEKKSREKINPNYISKPEPKPSKKTPKRKVRFFFAKSCYNTWSKLFVLTADGRLYSEYLFHYKLTVFEKKVDFNDFKADGFKWSGYQSIEEIDESRAKSITLTRQANWVESYLRNL